MAVRLETKNAVVRYGDFNALTLPQLRAVGGVIAVIGHNGSGKSTLLKTLLRLIQPATGTIALIGEDEGELRPELEMAFCPEGGAVFSDIPVRDYLRLWGRLRLGEPEAYRRRASLIEELGVTELLQQRGDSLSKGQRRRVQIAASYLTSPKVVLLDEPFDGLDVQRTEDLHRFIHTAVSESRCILTSHRMDVVERIADAVVVLERGSCVVSGSVVEVCQALAPESFAISVRGSVVPLVAALEAAFPQTIVYGKGRTAFVAGHVSEQELRRGYFQIAPEAEVERVPASLTDAMSYHLKNSTNPGTRSHAPA